MSDTLTTVKKRSTRVFISYSHDSDSHRDWVLLLASRLRRDGIDAWVDRYEEAPVEGWPRWMVNQISMADFVLAICTRAYRKRFEGKESGRGRGVTWEGFVCAQLLYEGGSLNDKFVPVIADERERDSVPTILAASTRYQLPDEYPALYRRLTSQPKVVPPSLGELLNVDEPPFEALPPRKTLSPGLPSPNEPAAGRLIRDAIASLRLWNRLTLLRRVLLVIGLSIVGSSALAALALLLYNLTEGGEFVPVMNLKIASLIMWSGTAGAFAWLTFTSIAGQRLRVFQRQTSARAWLTVGGMLSLIIVWFEAHDRERWMVLVGVGNLIVWFCTRGLVKATTSMNSNTGIQETSL